jgi:MFS family permease
MARFGRQLIGGEELASLQGIGVAFAIDSLSFALSALCLLLMNPLPAARTGEEDHPVRSVREGFAWVWREPEIRWMLVIIALANSLISGPLLVGLPVLSAQQLQGAAAFGIILSVFAGGNLVGMVLAGSLPRPSGRTFAAATVGLIAGFGLAMASFAFVTATWQALPLMGIVGAANGYMAVTFITQLQRITPEHMMGNVMGLFMFSMYGLMPLSQIIAGAVVRESLAMLFIGAGISLLAVALFAASRPEIRSLTARLDAAEPAEA